MPVTSPCEVLAQLDDPGLQLKAVREIKNGIIGNRRRKVAFASAGAIPRLVAVLRSAAGGFAAPQAAAGAADDACSEIVVHLVAALGSFAFGSTDSTERVVSAGAFPILRQLLFSANRKIVAAAARTMRIIVECKIEEGDHIFALARYQCSEASIAGKAGGLADAGEALTAVERLLQLVAEGQEGTTDVAASVLARACRTRDQQVSLSRAGAWDVIDGLLASTPKGQEAGLDLAACMVRGSMEEALYMLGRPKTNLASLLGLVQHHRRPFTRLLACTALASAVESGALPVDQKSHEVSVVLQTVIRLLSSEPHKGIKEAAPNIIILLIRNNNRLQSAACDAGIIRLLVTQGEAPGASVREKIAVMNCLECLAAENEEHRTQVGDAGGMRLVGACLRDRICSDSLLASALLLLLALSRSVRNLRTCIGDEQDLGEHLCLLLRSSRSLRIKARLSAVLCNLVINFSPVRRQLVTHGVIDALVPFLAQDYLPSSRAGDILEGADEKSGGDGPRLGGQSWQDLARSEAGLNAVWALRNLSYEADSSLARSLLQCLKGERLLQMIDPARIATAAGGWVGEQAALAEHALGLTRNLCHGIGTEGGAHAVLAAVGAGSVSKLVEALAGCMADDVPPSIVAEAVGAVSNMAANCPALRLEIGMHGAMMRQMRKMLTAGVRGARVSSEIGWCLVNLSFPAGNKVEPASVVEAKNRAQGGQAERRLSSTDASHAGGGGDAASCDDAAAARCQGPTGRPAVEAETLQQQGAHEVHKNTQSWNSATGASDAANFDIFAHMKSLGMAEAVCKLLEEEALDSDLGRRLERVLRVLSGERSAAAAWEEDERADAEEEAGACYSPDTGEEGVEDLRGDWVIMTTQMAQADDETAMEFDEESQRSALSDELPELPAHRQPRRLRREARIGTEEAAVRDGEPVVITERRVRAVDAVSRTQEGRSMLHWPAVFPAMQMQALHGVARDHVPIQLSPLRERSRTPTYL